MGDPSKALAGQVALVTGAGNELGIGFAIAIALAADGATVVVGSTTDRIHERASELTYRDRFAIRLRFTCVRNPAGCGNDDRDDQESQETAARYKHLRLF